MIAPESRLAGDRTVTAHMEAAVHRPRFLLGPCRRRAGQRRGDDSSRYSGYGFWVWELTASTGQGALRTTRSVVDPMSRDLTMP